MDLIQENEFLRLKIRSIVQKLKEKEAGATYEEIICRKVDKNLVR